MTLKRHSNIRTCRVIMDLRSYNLKNESASFKNRKIRDLIFGFFAILILRCHFLTRTKDNCRRRKKLGRCWKYSWSWNIQNISISSITRRCKGRARYYLIFISYIFIKLTEHASTRQAYFSDGLLKSCRKSRIPYDVRSYMEMI